jgi:phosphonoacetaldehyde hydrolase
MQDRIRLVVFDWAGTTVDHGCFAPVAPFVEALAKHGVTISAAEARGPMGLDKKDHLRALLALPDAARQWRDAHGGLPPAEDDVDRVFADVVPLAIESVRAHSDVIEGTLEAVKDLRARGIAIGSTTGYFREAADVCFARAAEQGFAPDAAYGASDVPAARPAPWMVLRNMEQLGVYPSAHVLKVGDTVPDIEEGRNAGAWTAGVTATSNDVGLMAADLAALPPDERAHRIATVAKKLEAAGAHAVIESVRDVPALVDAINARLARGDRP